MHDACTKICFFSASLRLNVIQPSALEEVVITVHNMEDPVIQDCTDMAEQTEGKRAVILACWAEMQVKRPLWIGHAALQSLHTQFWLGQWEKDKNNPGK